MIHKQLTRRAFLKTAGLGSILLTTSPRSLIPRKLTGPNIINIFPMYSSELYLDEAGISLAPTVRTGDKIRFLPVLDLDGFVATNGQENYFSHIILNIYEFTFRPILKLSEPFDWVFGPLFPGDKEKKTESNEIYLIRIASEFIAGYSRIIFVGKRERDLRIGQLYRGYGSFNNRESFRLLYGPTYKRYKSRIESLKLNAKVEKILDYGASSSWQNDEDKAFYRKYDLSDAWIYHSAFLTGFHYCDNFDYFKKAAVNSKNRIKTVQTNKECVFPIYRLKIL